MGKRLVGIAFVVVLAACSASSGGASPKLGDTLTINSGAAATPAGTTRTAFDAVVKALDAKDSVGLTQLIASGTVVQVDQCAKGILLDTAFGGERQVRITDDSGTPANVGQAVWVDANWLKSGTATCP